jgi:hypothetical protein
MSQFQLETQHLINTAMNRGEWRHVILSNGYHSETVETVERVMALAHHPAKAGC